MQVNYEIVTVFPTAARRKRLFGHSVAVDYYTGVGWIVGIPIMFILFTHFVTLSGEVLVLFSYSYLLASVVLMAAFTAISVAALITVLIGDPGVLVPGTAAVLPHRCPVCLWTVNEFDHHCPIIGGCIGIGTMRYFITFTGAAFMLCLVAFLICVPFCWHVAVAHAVFPTLRKSPLSAVTLVIKTYTATATRIWAVVFLITAIYGGLGCLALVSIHTAFSLKGVFSVERRRHRHDNPGIRYVFANYFHPRSALRAERLLSVDPV